MHESRMHRNKNTSTMKGMNACTESCETPLWRHIYTAFKHICVFACDLHDRTTEINKSESGLMYCLKLKVKPKL